MTEAEAVAALEALGASLVIEITYTHSSSVAAGDVISMDPPADTVVEPGTTVNLVVSLGETPLLQSRWTGFNNQQAVAIADDTQTIVPVMFVDLDFVGDRLRLNDSSLQLNWGGFDWLGAGEFGGIDGISETQDLIAQPVKLSLSGVDAANITEAMTTQYQGRDVTIYIGLLHPRTLVFLDTPEEVWSGFMDVMTIELDHGLARIELTCEHWLRVLPAAVRYTDQQQQALFANDRIFQFLHLIQGHVGKWGARDVTHGGGGGAGGGAGGGGPRNPRRPH